MDDDAVGNEQEPRALMARYFADLEDGDAARHLTEDVVWVNEETGQRITGPTAVIAYVRALHARMGDLRTRTYIVGRDAAMIEGDCMPLTGGNTSVGDESTTRLPYVVVDDLKPGAIAAMRLHMSITRLPPDTQSPLVTWSHRLEPQGVHVSWRTDGARRTPGRRHDRTRQWRWSMSRRCPTATTRTRSTSSWIS